MNRTRLLNLNEAAAYCGISAPTFSAVCPVQTISLGPGKRLERYDIKQLDVWIDSLGCKTALPKKNWLTAWDKTHDRRSSERD